MEEWAAGLLDRSDATDVLGVTNVPDGSNTSFRLITAPGEITENVPPGPARLHIVVSGTWTLGGLGETAVGVQGDAVMSGPRDRVLQLSTSGGRMIIVELSAIAWLRLTSLSAHILANRIFRLENASAIRRLVIAWSEGAGMDDADAFAPLPDQKRSQPSKPREAMVRHVTGALKSDVLPTVMQLARSAGASGRTLHRCCIQAFGFGPMSLLKRERLLRALQRVRDGNYAKITDVISSDYCDQSHFNRDFKTLMGTTPTEYRRRVTEWQCNELPTGFAHSGSV
jgi:AraC-like DNA-binding protein